MLDRERLADETAAFKRDARRHFNAAVTALLALAWERRAEDFSFSGNPDIQDGALRICIELSDKCASSAEKRLKNAIEGILEEGDLGDEGREDELDRMDMAGTHLLDLLAVWLGVAAANGWTQGYTRVMISRYLANPFLCPEWKSVPRNAISWGRGYSRDIAGQLGEIGQNRIIGGARRAEWRHESAAGATYYIRRRGSFYDCPECDSLCGFPIPIEVPWEVLHSRCLCFPEYHYDPLPE